VWGGQGRVENESSKQTSSWRGLKYLHKMMEIDEEINVDRFVRRFCSR
jgi:hypothetical protein